ncbi:MAG: 30S ribosomal protein S17 [Anaerolineae bacterium]
MRERRKRLVGRVTSDKMDKTVVVRVERLKRHRLYGKVLRVFKKYKAHDEENRCRVGDLVRIVESRPLSREKRWVVEAILERAQGPQGAPPA